MNLPSLPADENGACRAIWQPWASCISPEF